MNKKALFAFGFWILLLGFTNCFSNSLWNKTSSSPYTPDKSYKAGDIITVLIAETTTAQQKAGTNTNVKDDMALKFTHTIERLNPLIGQSNAAGMTLGNKYTGTGLTQRTSAVTSKVAATVVEVMPNGNLRIEGSHILSVNDENQEVFISGIVRAKDISIANTINSYQVADANVSVRGSGVVQEAENPGWITRILNWIF